jgi:hypothetical protein
VSLTQDIYQSFGAEGKHERFNLHVDSTRIGWAMFAKAENPATKNILISECRNIKLGDKFFNTANLTAGGVIVSVSTEGRLKLNVETLVGGTFIADTILIGIRNVAGVFTFVVKKVSTSGFTAGDPDTYGIGTDIDYAICEITTTAGMTQILQSAIKDVRGKGIAGGGGGGSGYSYVGGQMYSHNSANNVNTASIGGDVDYLILSGTLDSSPTTHYFSLYNKSDKSCITGKKQNYGVSSEAYGSVILSGHIYLYGIANTFGPIIEKYDLTGSFISAKSIDGHVGGYQVKQIIATTNRIIALSGGIDIYVHDATLSCTSWINMNGVGAICSCVAPSGDVIIGCTLGTIYSVNSTGTSTNWKKTITIGGWGGGQIQRMCVTTTHIYAVLTNALGAHSIVKLDLAGNLVAHTHFSTTFSGVIGINEHKGNLFVIFGAASINILKLDLDLNLIICKSTNINNVIPSASIYIDRPYFATTEYARHFSAATPKYKTIFELEDVITGNQSSIPSGFTLSNLTLTTGSQTVTMANSTNAETYSSKTTTTRTPTTTNFSEHYTGALYNI